MSDSDSSSENSIEMARVMPDMIDLGAVDVGKVHTLGKIEI